MRKNQIELSKKELPIGIGRYAHNNKKGKIHLDPLNYYKLTLPPNL